MLLSGKKRCREEQMMSQRSKRELWETIQPRYLRATKTGKKNILDEFIATTGYHRKYAIRILKHGYPRGHYKKKGKAPVYRGEVVQALEEIWEIYGRICSKRLHPFLPEGIRILERCKEINLAPEVKQLLLNMSRSTIDRCLRPARFKSKVHGLSTTKPGTLLKKMIPVRTFADWNEDQPGFMEIDLVAHCGESGEGQFLNTLTCTDICTGWTEPIALRRRSSQVVRDALHNLRPELPFPLLGLDSDNGSEFINDLLYNYCLGEQITFTRSRPYKKNDQSYVEQKNWSVVRHTIGYDRLESDEEFELLTSIYSDLRLYINFFQPVLKLVFKGRVDNKFIKTYDLAKTPYQRIMTRSDIPLSTKAYLADLYVKLNPVELRNSIDRKVANLWNLPK
jgi:hypothetical protein